MNDVYYMARMNVLGFLSWIYIGYMLRFTVTVSINIYIWGLDMKF